MKTSQKRAIWYSDRERRLKKLEKLGLLKEYRTWNKGHSYNRITAFYKEKGISENMIVKVSKETERRLGHEKR